MDSSFKEKVDGRNLRVGVIGLGYVGLPLVMAFAKKGFPTVGFDIDDSKIEMLAAGKSYLKHIPRASIAELNETGGFTPTSDFSLLEGVDVIIICVPTPLTAHREPDLRFIRSTAETIYPRLKPGRLVTLESTTYPGTTEEVLLPILEKSGLKCGRDFFLAYSPEREDPGNKRYNTETIPKVVGGHTPEACERAAYLFKRVVVDVITVSSTRSAEAVKLTENIFRSVNIALVNELKMIFAKMDIDIWEVIEAVKSKPFGYMPFYPGPGLGGHCIPIDPFYLTWKAHEYDCPTRFIEIAGEINTSMPSYVVQELMNALNERGKALKNCKVLLLGMAYKRDVGDYRESPSLKLLEILREKAAEVNYHDPFIPVLGKTRGYPYLEGLKSIDLTPETIRNHDVVLIATDHSSIDYEELVAEARLVLDTRNATKNVKNHRDRIVKA